MREPTDFASKPDIVIGTTDYERLEGLASSFETRLPSVTDDLLAELSRARLVPDGALPADSVRMGSVVRFRTDATDEKTLQLVFPGDADIANGKISILTPIGTALIGLSAGQSIAWCANDGRRHRLTVVSVSQPPLVGGGPELQSPDRG
ncbi:nucleoside diphosphate kinase regulator [Roseibium aggregatum]|uniref:nucleoside diphosphate kinase regulator n=1 Tax=Roseibium aggregatum TaxID=187304 RepID=UPI001E31041F|nr:nucleoside diphosphate kinase regulator [Roseibium aggregatum]UES53739.1 nucleoside diphosphate kinase regulator [Roseibium aggregatum]